MSESLDTEDYRAWNKAKQEKRAKNREDSAQILRYHGISFVEKNGGAHLVVTSNGQTFDFWPGTGLWKKRGALKAYRGVRVLLKAIAELP